MLLLARYPLRILGVKIDYAVQANFDFVDFIPKLKNRVADGEIKFVRRESVRKFRARWHRETHEGFFIFEPRRNKTRSVGCRTPTLSALGVGRARIEGFERFVQKICGFDAAFDRQRNARPSAKPALPGD